MVSSSGSSAAAANGNKLNLGKERTSNNPEVAAPSTLNRASGFRWSYEVAVTFRARLAEKLLQSLETLSDAEIEQLWASEALRRSEELERGIGTLRDAQEVLRDARSRLR